LQLLFERRRPGASGETGFAAPRSRSYGASASVLRFVLAGGKPSFDVDLAAFAEEPFGHGSEPSEHDHPEPFPPRLLRAVAIRETLGRGQREIRHVLSGVGQRPNHWIRSRLPITITLLIAIAVCLLGLTAPASAKRQGVLSFSIPRRFFPRRPCIYEKARE